MTRKRVHFRAVSVGRGLDYVKLAAVIIVAALYSYALFLQPMLRPEDGLLNPPLARLAAVFTGPFARAEDGQCGLPLGVAPPGASGVLPVTTGSLYGAVAESNLPWFAEPPPRLARLQQQWDARQLVSAFRVTLPHPIWDEAANVAQGAAYLAGTVLRPGQSMSLFAVIGPFTEDRGYGDGPSYANNRVVPSLGGGVCKIATALYNAAVHSDITVLERKPHSMLVPYVPPGRDAAVATGAKDVRLRNDNDTPVLLWAGMEDTTLYVAVYGQYEPPFVEWFHEETNRRTAAPIRRENSDLPPGTEQRVSEGYDGVTVRTWIVIRRPGQPEERRDMGVDTYRPMPGVIEYNL